MRELPTYDDVVAAAVRIRPHVHHTPVFTSAHIDELVGAAIYFKAENMQKVGAFKARGATNAVLSLDEDRARRGVATHSSGNHGQAVAYAARIRGIRATVVMPDHAPAVKVDAVAGYGAEIVFCAQSERAVVLDDVIARTGATMVHPFDDGDVIAGQGTAALELIGDVPGLDMVVTPIGGGGLMSGTSLVGREHGVEVVGAEPEVVDDAARSLRDGVRHDATGAMSVGDGLLTGIGELAFTILHRHGREVLTVGEEEIIAAMLLVAERMKLVIEPSSATVVAAMLRYRDVFGDGRVGAIISGGNVDLTRFGPQTTNVERRSSST